MRELVLSVMLVATMLGCSRTLDEGAMPVLPAGDDSVAAAMSRPDVNGPHRLWGEWTFYFNEDHTRVDAVPRRNARLHLNLLRFLEEYCTDCLEIISISSNGDGTADLTVRITHPFPGHPEYTGFDVRGIIMFEGSHEFFWISNSFFPYMEPVWVSWRELGDPEVLNADGYTPLWSPYWDSGSDMPMFNYQPGKYTRGTPTANINAFLNFYTDEERHMLRADGSVERTYHIWLPGGPVIAGYAVDASWAPPTVTPVTDPLNDFPVSANAPEPYYFRTVINNGEPITEEPCCGSYDGDCTTMWVDIREWYGVRTTRFIMSRFDHGYICSSDLLDCIPGTAPQDVLQTPVLLGITDEQSNGYYQAVAMTYRSKDPDLFFYAAYDVLEYEINIPD